MKNFWKTKLLRNLFTAKIELLKRPERENLLKVLLKPFKERFRYIFIDCPPSFGLLTLNALVAAESVLVPVQCEYFAMEGLFL